MRRAVTITALAGALAIAALAPMPSAQATTAPGYQFAVGVFLTNTGITLRGVKSVRRGSEVQFLIINSSKQSRRFTLGGRKTDLLKPRQRGVFFLGFDLRGSYHYRSSGPHATAFGGTFTVT